MLWSCVSSPIDVSREAASVPWQLMTLKKIVLAWHCWKFWSKTRTSDTYQVHVGPRMGIGLPTREKICDPLIPECCCFCTNQVLFGAHHNMDRQTLQGRRSVTQPLWQPRPFPLPEGLQELFCAKCFQQNLDKRIGGSVYELLWSTALSLWHSIFRVSRNTFVKCSPVVAPRPWCTFCGVWHKMQIACKLFSRITTPSHKFIVVAYRYVRGWQESHSVLWPGIFTIVVTGLGTFPWRWMQRNSPVLSDHERPQMQGSFKFQKQRNSGSLLFDTKSVWPLDSFCQRELALASVLVRLGESDWTGNCSLSAWWWILFVVAICSAILGACGEQNAQTAFHSKHSFQFGRKERLAWFNSSLESVLSSKLLNKWLRGKTVVVGWCEVALLRRCPTDGSGCSTCPASAWCGASIRYCNENSAVKQFHYCVTLH